MLKNMVLIVVCVIMTAGCTQNIPMKTSINEFVLMSIKTSSQKGVNYTYTSNLLSTNLPLYGKDKAHATSSGMTYICDENRCLGTMLSEYMQNKFLEIDSNSHVSVSIRLEDFYVEYYCTDSGGMQLLQGLAGSPSNLNYVSSAKLLLVITVTIDGHDSVKRFTASSDVSSTGGQTVGCIGDSINQVNNKALMLINSFFTENGL